MVGVAPLHTITTPGTGLGGEGPSGIAISIPPRRAGAVQRPISAVITFDAGQTLVELDLDFLAARLGTYGVEISSRGLAEAAREAWRQYDALVDAGAGHRAAWLGLMSALLEGAGIAAAPHAERLYRDNAAHNLWRAPVAGMFELARELVVRGITVGVLSNSEGRLAELLEEIGQVDVFRAVIDSGRIGLEKPDRAIFEHAQGVLGGGTPTVHIGDSWDADIAGARGAGWRAIWFGRRVTEVDDPEVAIARDAGEVRAALVRWQIL